MNKLANPHTYHMYDLPQAQMDGGAKCTVTNNLRLLKDVKWYNRWFRPTVTIKGATSNNIIIPDAQGYFQVPNIAKGVTINILCYYSPEFISTLLSDNDVLLANNNASNYVEQLIMKVFDQKELDKIEKLPIPNLCRQAAKIRKQESDNTTKHYTHNYGNCMICYTHKNKFNWNIYIPGIICVGLCYTIPLIIPNGLQASDPAATISNSKRRCIRRIKISERVVIWKWYNWFMNISRKNISSWWMNCSRSL